MPPKPLDYESRNVQPPRTAGASLGILSCLLFLLALSIVGAQFAGLAFIITCLGWTMGAVGLFLDRQKLIAIAGITLNLVLFFVIGVFALGMSLLHL